ncbi:MAG: hypothetical protein ACKOPS_28455 [Cyanobium sp.]
MEHNSSVDGIVSAAPPDPGATAREKVPTADGQEHQGLEQQGER